MNDVKDIHNNYDTVFKEALMLYKNKTLDFLGLDLAMIDNPINTEFTEIQVNKNFTDMCFMLKDGTGLHAEWEVDISTDDMLRFCSYNVNYLRMYKTVFTTVIFTNRKQQITQYKNSMLKFNPIVVNLGERNGDALLQKIKKQIEDKQPINELELIYLPLYYSKYKNVAEMLEQVVELAPQVSDSKEDNEKIMILSAVLSNKFMNENDFEKIWEAIKMYVDDLLLVKFAKKDAKTEGVNEIVVKMLKKGLDTEIVAEYTDLPVEEIERIKESFLDD